MTLSIFDTRGGRKTGRKDSDVKTKKLSNFKKNVLISSYKKEVAALKTQHGAAELGDLSL